MPGTGCYHLRRLRDIQSGHVFLYRGLPVSDIRSSLKVACRKAGIIYGRFEKNGFVFHDLRHSFVTFMRKAGVPESVIMEITGHSTQQMFVGAGGENRTRTG